MSSIRETGYRGWAGNLLRGSGHECERECMIGVEEQRLLQATVRGRDIAVIERVNGVVVKKVCVFSVVLALLFGTALFEGLFATLLAGGLWHADFGVQAILYPGASAFGAAQP